MGRPVKSYFFGKYNPDGVGGEGVASVTILANGTGYSPTTITAVFSAPEIAGGSLATGTPQLDVNGNVGNVLITSAGSGYIAVPTITFLGANTGAASGTPVLTAVTFTANAINANAWVTGDTVGRNADIIKQVGSRTYYVQDKNGGLHQGRCKLVTTATPAAEGEMTITATFADASTFSVAKMTDRLVYSSTGQAYTWADYSSTTNHALFATASNATTPPTVSISNN